MARFNSKNTDTKSSGLSNVPPPNATEITLTPEQEGEISRLKEELATYQQRLTQTRNKQNQIKTILDNFEKVVVGDIILDILPDEDSDEIINSPIISLQEVTDAISGVTYPQISSEYSTAVKAILKNLSQKVFQLNIIKLLIEQSTELEDGELYLPLWYRSIETLPGVQETYKEALREILRAIEIDLL